MESPSSSITCSMSSILKVSSPYTKFSASYTVWQSWACHSTSMYVECVFYIQQWKVIMLPHANDLQKSGKRAALGYIWLQRNKKNKTLKRFHLSATLHNPVSSFVLQFSILHYLQTRELFSSHLYPIKKAWSPKKCPIAKLEIHIALSKSVVLFPPANSCRHLSARFGPIDVSITLKFNHFQANVKIKTNMKKTNPNKLSRTKFL